jgi:hypothetical protein
MIDSYTATYVLVGFLIIFGVILPIFDKLPKIKDFISLRWTIIVIYSAMCIGVIIDFNHLDTSVRFAVVVGGIVLSAIFLLVRSLEKAAVNKWKYPRIRGAIKRGDTQAEISLAEKSQIGVSPAEKIEIKNKNEEYERKHEESMKELSKFVLSQDQSGIDFDEKMNQAMSIGIAKQQQKK